MSPPTKAQNQRIENSEILSPHDLFKAYGKATDMSDASIAYGLQVLEV